MARRRFLVEQIRDKTAELSGPDARHLTRVLRAVPGQQYEISDGGGVYLAEITAVDRDRVVFQVLQELDAPQLPVRVVLLAALIKFDRFEWLVEKATELGVAAVIPVQAARSDKGLLEASRKRVERWRRIAHESSQQSRRLTPPEIADAVPLADALRTAATFRYFLDEKPGRSPLLAAMAPASERHRGDSIALLAGPEGGWTDPEREAAQAAGWTAVSLGPLILRAETAALTAAGVVLHGWWASQLE